MAKKLKEFPPGFFDQAPVILEITDSDFPPALFERSPFVIPSIIAKDVEVPIISVERHLKRSDIEKTDNFLDMVAQFRNIDKQLGIKNRELSEEFSFLSICIADAKEYHVKQDLHLLVDLVDRYFDRELKKIGVDIDELSSDIIQIVEVDFTMIDLYPGDTEIHYRLYTKRGIARQHTDEQ